MLGLCLLALQPQLNITKFMIDSLERGAFKIKTDCTSSLEIKIDCASERATTGFPWTDSSAARVVGTLSHHHLHSHIGTCSIVFILFSLVFCTNIFVCVWSVFCVFNRIFVSHFYFCIFKYMCIFNCSFVFVSALLCFQLYFISVFL